MSKLLVSKLAVVRERQRLTTEYLDWVRLVGDDAAVSGAERDLARHRAELAKLERRVEAGRAVPGQRRSLVLVRDVVPAIVFGLTATIVTLMGRWDAGLVGLLDGLAAALVYLYFSKDTGRLRL